MASDESPGINTEEALDVLVYKMIRNYVNRKVESKTGLRWDAVPPGKRREVDEAREDRAAGISGCPKPQRMGTRRLLRGDAVLRAAVHQARGFHPIERGAAEGRGQPAHAHPARALRGELDQARIKDRGDEVSTMTERTCSPPC